LRGYFCRACASWKQGPQRLCSLLVLRRSCTAGQQFDVTTCTSSCLCLPCHGDPASHARELVCRSAPTKSLARAPALRTSPAASAQGLPSDCGIDPATGEICAGDPSIILHTSVKMGDKKKAFMAAVSKVQPLRHTRVERAHALTHVCVFVVAVTQIALSQRGLRT